MNYKKLFEDNRKKIKNIIFLVTKENNEDLEQEVYLKALRYRSRYKEKGKLLNWLSTITYNVARDYLKSSKKRYESSFDEESKITELKDEKISLEEHILQKERQEKILKAIDSLNKKHKEVIVLSEIYNYTYEEISKKLNCPIGTVKSRIYNAKKELAILLKDLL